MNDDIIKGQWKELVGEARLQWGKLTDNDLAIAEGTTEKLVGSIQKRYGVSKDDAARQVDDWASRVTKSLKKD